MQYVGQLIGIVSGVLWWAYWYNQRLDLAWLLTIASKLRRARNDRRWTIEEVAEKIGVDWTTYSRWERGQQEPHLRNVKMLEQIFSMAAEDLGMDQASRWLRHLTRNEIESWSDYETVRATATMAKSMRLDGPHTLRQLIEFSPVEHRSVVRQLVEKRNLIIHGLPRR